MKKKERKEKWSSFISKWKLTLCPSFSSILWGLTSSGIPTTWPHLTTSHSFFCDFFPPMYKCFEVLPILIHTHTHTHTHTHITSTHQATPWITFLFPLPFLYHQVSLSGIPFPHHLTMCNLTRYKKFSLDNHWRIKSNSFFFVFILLRFSAASHYQLLFLHSVFSHDFS